MRAPTAYQALFNISIYRFRLRIGPILKCFMVNQDNDSRCHRFSLLFRDTSLTFSWLRTETWLKSRYCYHVSGHACSLFGGHDFYFRVALGRSTDVQMTGAKKPGSLKTNTAGCEQPAASQDDILSSVVDCLQFFEISLFVHSEVRHLKILEV